jgi:hypothetical protein
MRWSGWRTSRLLAGCVLSAVAYTIKLKVSSIGILESQHRPQRQHIVCCARELVLSFCFGTCVRTFLAWAVAWVSLLMLASSFAGQCPDPVGSPTLSLPLPLSVISQTPERSIDHAPERKDTRMCSRTQTFSKQGGIADSAADSRQKC